MADGGEGEGGGTGTGAAPSAAAAATPTPTTPAAQHAARDGATATVASFYGAATASAYASTMEEEMKTYVGDLDVFMAGLLPGPILDTSAGSGHMLAHLHRHMPERALHGADISPSMLAVAAKTCPVATLVVGDMRDLAGWADASVAGLISTFALHHVGQADAARCVREWGRVLKPGGRAYIALWEGEGSMDMPPLPDGTPVPARNWPVAEVRKWVADAGLDNDLHRTAPYPDFDANMAFFIVSKPGGGGGGDGVGGGAGGAGAGSGATSGGSD